MPVDIDMNEMPDMVPTLAVLCAFAEGVSRIGNVAHLRIKESDRLYAVAAGLEVLGIHAQELPDGLIIHGAPLPRRLPAPFRHLTITGSRWPSPWQACASKEWS